MDDSSDFSGNLKHLKQSLYNAVPVTAEPSSTVASVGDFNGPKLTLLPFIKTEKEEELPIRETL